MQNLGFLLDIDRPNLGLQVFGQIGHNLTAQVGDEFIAAHPLVQPRQTVLEPVLPQAFVPGLFEGTGHPGYGFSESVIFGPKLDLRIIVAGRDRLCLGNDFAVGLDDSVEGGDEHPDFIAPFHRLGGDVQPFGDISGNTVEMTDGIDDSLCNVDRHQDAQKEGPHQHQDHHQDGPVPGLMGVFQKLNRFRFGECRQDLNFAIQILHMTGGDGLGQFRSLFGPPDAPHQQHAVPDRFPCNKSHPGGLDILLIA